MFSENNKWIMRKAAGYFVLFAAVFVLQTTLVQKLAIFGVKPNLIAVCVACVAVMENIYVSAAFGLLMGLAADILGGGVVGFYAILYMWLGFLISIITDRHFVRNKTTCIVLSASLSAAVSLITYIFFFAFWGKGDILSAMRLMIAESVYSAVAVYAVYPAARWISIRTGPVEK